jgi:hypothetical protein
LQQKKNHDFPFGISDIERAAIPRQGSNRLKIMASIPVNNSQPWYTRDMSLSKNFQWNRVGIRITAEVNNIFNQQYEIAQVLPDARDEFKN